MSRLLHPTQWRFRHRNAAGEIIWASGVGELDRPILPGSKLWIELDHDQPWNPNLLTDSGENNMLDVYLRATTTPTNFYIALTNTTIGETTTLATANTSEPSGNGYGRQLVERSATGWPTLSGDTATSSTETFTASGGSIGPVTDAFITDSPSGTTGGTGGNIVIIGNALSTTRTLADGESLDVSFDVTAA